jgi:transposase
MLRGMPRPAKSVNLDDAARRQLQQWVAAHGTPQQVALRCCIVLAAADGRNNVAVGEEFGVDVKTVALWRARFVDTGAQGLWEIAPGRGRKPMHGPEKVKAIIDATLQTKPNGATHWSCRTMRRRASVKT